MSVLSLIKDLLDSDHSFSSAAVHHHGIGLDTYEARNLAYMCGFSAGLADFVGEREFDSYLLFGREGILTVDIRYAGRGEGPDSRTFTFSRPEWVGWPPQSKIASIYGLKSELDRHGYDTAWIESGAGNEFTVHFGDNNADAFLTENGELVYNSGMVLNDNQRNAIQIAEDFGFEIDLPGSPGVNPPRFPMNSQFPTPAELRRMEESIRYHQG